ncbi:MAG: UbiA family prenyltransferase [candidate division Zixibacteria bacterium]|nr:UbiA family prenyltransferase [candidate division Zixibacteria bacterium]MDD5425886.1 UbiA family prenyltransferase [candidate division Zixibacteria bacterium]
MRALDFIFAARPLLVMPVWSVFLVALRYHHHLAGKNFQTGDFLNLAGLSLVFAGALYLNQVFDYESDLINEKLGFLQKNVISLKAMMSAYLVVTLTALVIGIFISVVTLAVYLQIFVAGYIYSAPPWRLKDRVVSSLLINGYAYGFLVALSIMPHINLHNAGLLGWDSPFYFFITIMSITCITTIPDIKGDRATGKRTVAVRLGSRGALGLAFLLMALSVYPAHRSGFLELVYLSVVSALLILVTLFVNSEKMILFTAKFPLLLVTLLAGYFYPLYFLFIVALLIFTRIYYKKRFNLTYPEMA